MKSRRTGKKRRPPRWPHAQPIGHVALVDVLVRAVQIATGQPPEITRERVASYMEFEDPPQGWNPGKKVPRARALTFLKDVARHPERFRSWLLDAARVARDHIDGIPRH